MQLSSTQLNISVNPPLPELFFNAGCVQAVSALFLDDMLSDRLVQCTAGALYLSHSRRHQRLCKHDQRQFHDLLGLISPPIGLVSEVFKCP